MKPIEAFAELYSPHRYKIFYGGRGSGKSHAVAQALTFLSSNINLRILCCREIQNSIKDSSYQVLKDMTDRLGIGHEFKFTESEILHMRTGSRFIFSGLLRNENSIRSKEGIDICWIEEASSVSQRSWDVLTPTIRKPGSELWLTFNPLTVDDPTNVFIENPPPNAYVRKVNYWDNPFFPEVLREQMEWDKQNDFEKYLHVWEGYPLTISDAQVFKGRFVVEPIPEDLWKNPTVSFSARTLALRGIRRLLCEASSSTTSYSSITKPTVLASKSTNFLSSIDLCPGLINGRLRATQHVQRRSAICVGMATTSTALRSGRIASRKVSTSSRASTRS